MATGEVTWADLITRLIGGGDLEGEDTSWAMDQVMSGNAHPIALGGFLVALRAKGETVPEVRGLADAMVAHAVPIDVDPDAVDIVGTGGDRHRSVNFSTMAALVVAGTGTTVVKHGNRASSSASGSADVLEALGVRLELSPEQAAQVVQSAGITFLFANAYHPSFRHAAATRRELGVATAFNILGPLTNPARPRAGAIGVADPRMAPLVAGVFADRENSTLVFRSEDGLDEMSTTAPVRIWEVTEAGGPGVSEHLLDPAELFGFPRATLEALRGGDPVHNAQVAREVLAGAEGPIRDTVLLNAAAALVAHGRLAGTATGPLTDRLAAGLDHARRSIDDGAAAATLESWAAASQAV
ncbi:MAG TPA: anthranilate phosphoribosyltransferase [Candidatus Ruania gallistercoris]|uniref:Anthranilate phosphoribosyltransferase n=1 Tax=Candidatus Ruania gallistercoris TaxID=2838746 RepID=A0A9D2J3Z6_9MICO|nr:anthranilate phosphoribosyltransferase [Candidatus Ruania gallistercoris]